MIDMRVSHDNLLELELVLVEKRKNAFDLIARIDNQSFPRTFIADNGAIAAEHSDRKYLMNQRLTSNRTPGLRGKQSAFSTHPFWEYGACNVPARAEHAHSFYGRTESGARLNADSLVLNAAYRVSGCGS